MELQNESLPIPAPADHSANSVPPGLSLKEKQSGTRLAKLVGSRRKVRRIAETVLAHRELSLEETAVLLNALEKPSAFRWREALLAAWCAGFVPPHRPQQEEIVKTLAAKLKKFHWHDLVYVFLARWGSLSLLLTVVYLLIWHDMSALPGSLLLSALGGLLSAILPCYLVTRGWDDWTYSLLRRTSAQALSRISLPSCVAPLAEAINNTYGEFDGSVGWRKVRRIAREGFPRAAATLRPEHYLQLEPSIVPGLCLLIEDRNEEMALLALDALGKVGDGRAVIPVQRIADKHASLRRRELAKAILPTLQFRHDQENSYTHLLRASSAPVGADTLLRPAMNKPENSPQTLLRPSQFDFDVPSSSPPSEQNDELN